MVSSPTHRLTAYDWEMITQKTFISLPSAVDYNTVCNNPKNLPKVVLSLTQNRSFGCYNTENSTQRSSLAHSILFHMQSDVSPRTKYVTQWLIE